MYATGTMVLAVCACAYGRRYYARCSGSVVGQAMIRDSCDRVFADCEGCRAGGCDCRGVYGMGFVSRGCVCGRFVHELGGVSSGVCW